MCGYGLWFGSWWVAWGEFALLDEAADVAWGGGFAGEGGCELGGLGGGEVGGFELLGGWCGGGFGLWGVFLGEVVDGLVVLGGEVVGVVGEVEC